MFKQMFNLLVIHFIALFFSINVANAESVDDIYDEAFDEWYSTDFVQEANKEYLKGYVTNSDYNQTMKFFKSIHGNAEPGSRKLFISLHGGGGAPSEVNDQQWSNQTQLYQIPEGVYIAPRAPTDEWNMWFKPGMENLFYKIIIGAIINDGVDPYQVYLLGYSAGGDGVWQMAPRMADTWAAASMMAGHPNGRSMINLRNLPFMIWVGALDSAYNRNQACTEKALELKNLHKQDPNGYIYSFHKVKGKGHWMDLEDQKAIYWMSEYQLNYYPDRVVWLQEHEFPKKYFYYLSVRDDEIQEGKELVVSYQQNNDNSTTYIIEKSDYSEVSIYIDPEIVNLDKPVKVIYGDKVVFNGKVSLSKKVAKELARNRIFMPYIFPAKVVVNLD